MSEGCCLVLRRTDSGWPSAWRNLLRNLGIYDRYRGEKDHRKREIIDAELSRFGGRFLADDEVSVEFWFPDEGSMLHFRMVWE